MAISTGDKLPEATLYRMGDNGPEGVALSDFTKGRKVVLFALPGAYTGPCTTAHVPSFVRTAKQFFDKGVDAIICIAANDPFVMKAWGEFTGAEAAGLTFLGDPGSEFILATGRYFNAPPAGLLNRSNRYSLYAEDGVIKVINAEEDSGQCDISAGEKLLEKI